VPGGRINPEEPILEGLQREIIEETGLVVKVGDVMGVYESFSNIKGEDCHIVRVYYVAYLETIEEVNLSTDHDFCEWVSLEDLADKQLMSNLEELVHKVLG
jgi:8-oxo-dGTP pyrophosphatase MutT (NUDIX family)